MKISLFDTWIFREALRGVGLGLVIASTLATLNITQLLGGMFLMVYAKLLIG